MAGIEPYLQKIAARFTNPEVQASLKGFTRTLQFTFTDTGETWLLRVIDGKEAVLRQEAAAAPDIQVTTNTETLAGIMDGTVHAASAYMQRKIQVKGAMNDLLKLQRFMM